MSDDFCELIKHQLIAGVDVEKKRVGLQTLIAEWKPTSDKPQTKVIGLGIF